MIPIHSKETKDSTWVCYATINGYDYSFEDKLLGTAQAKMSALLYKLGYDRMDVNYESPKLYPKPHV